MSIEPFPSMDAHFDQNGSLDKTASSFDAAKLADATDLIVISHGWNNNAAEARGLYDGFFASVDALRASGTLPIPAVRKFAVARIFWPSKKFDLPQGGVAAAAGNPSLEAAEAQLQLLIDGNSDPGARDILVRAKNLLPDMQMDPSKGDEFVRLVLSTATTDTEEKDSISTVFTNSGMSGSEMLDALGRAPTPPPAIDTVAAAAEDRVAAFGFPDILGGAIGFLNLFTYKTMKERAGVVGVKGVAPLLADVRVRYPSIRMHLIGHSFGGRLVTSVANAFPGGDWGHQISSLMLLQAAFSQFGFAKNYLNTGHDGAFRGIILKKAVAGEIAITHTTNDRAVGLAYPLASRLFNQVASAIGDAHDLFGGIGTNGAQDTPEAVGDTLQAPGFSYTALPNGIKIRNLLADTYIHDHGDVKGLQVAFVAMRNAVFCP